MTISLDAWGGPWWTSARPLSEQLAGTDVLFANEAEAAAIRGRPTVARAGTARRAVRMRRDQARRAGAIGAAGAEVYAVPVDPVELVDATGAGDAFNAGFLAGWLGGLELEASLTLGVICGSRAAGDYGGYRGCPREPELREIAAARGIALPTRGGAP